MPVYASGSVKNKNATPVGGLSACTDGSHGTAAFASACEKVANTKGDRPCDVGSPV